MNKESEGTFPGIINNPIGIGKTEINNFTDHE